MLLFTVLYSQIPFTLKSLFSSNPAPVIKGWIMELPQALTKEWSAIVLSFMHTRGHNLVQSVHDTPE